MALQGYIGETVVKLIDGLFEVEERQLSKRRTKLIDKNTAAGGNPAGFYFNGEIFAESPISPGLRRSLKPLDPSLLMEAGSIVADRKVINFDKGRVNQLLTMLLKDCHSTQDVRDALPNCMVEFLPGGSNLPRTRPEAFTLADNPLSYKQYMQSREKMDYYVAARLLY
ncbi:hypothetical protein [Mesorhizobium sp. CN2-181]|uniref:hypothetical protein n=1 Tax=Mesorhizobium yinganensis TaxID=3157707 RepID=UPI0032B76D3C